MSVDLDLIIQNITQKFSGIYFLLITTENGVVERSYINENEFNPAKIAINMSMTYESSEDITSEIGIEKPDFSLIHSQNFYILSMKILEHLIIILCDDQINVSDIFTTINDCIVSSS